MASTTPRPASVRSLADLGTLYGRNHAERRTSEAQRRLRDGDLPAYSDTGPYIPCALCGVNLKYMLAVARVIDAATVYSGYTHPVGMCDAKAVADWQAKNVLTAEANAKRAAQVRSA